MKKIFLAILITFLGFNSFWASHVSGGQITVEWVSANTYNIKVSAYRDCNPGSSTLSTSLTLGIYQIGTNVQQSSLTLSNYIDNQNIPLGDGCYTPTSLCIDERVYYINNVYIPDYANGYYLQTNIYARSNNIDNIASPGSTSMVFYTEIPDPALGQNSTPAFAAYPADAYLCIGNLTSRDMSATDADGDSLAYSLVTPLQGSTTNGTSAGSGAYPYYSGISWTGGYNLANICGGTPAMSIDPITGEIIASPAVQGEFVFAIRVEEYRNGVKIGEVRRDLQYASLSCTLDQPPLIDLADSVSVYYGDSICVDMTILDSDGTDTIYVTPTSPNFDLVGNYYPPTFNGTQYEYTNWENSGTSSYMSHYDSLPGGVYEGVGTINLRYCWSPQCGDIDSVYSINLLAYSLGCSGSDTTEKEVILQMLHQPIPQSDLDGFSDTVQVTYGDLICFDILNEVQVNDTLEIRLTSTDFDLTGNFVPADVGTNGQNYYLNFFGNDTLYHHPVDFYPFNDQYIGIQVVPLRYCFDPECESIDEVYALNLEANTIGCGGSDTLITTYYVEVDYEVEPIELSLPSVLEVKYAEELCFEIFVEDTAQTGLTIGITPESAILDFDEIYVAPSSDASGYYYADFMGMDTLRISDYDYGNQTIYGTYEIGARYCWVPGCNDVVLKEYQVDVQGSIYTDCFTLSNASSMVVQVEPPTGEVQIIPNVFTPNGDGDNDYFKLGGTPDPCFDSIVVTIYNRWGKKVFESEDPYFEWDGTLKGKGNADCAEGTYFVIMNGTYGSIYDPSTGEAVPTPIEQKYTIQLLR